MVVVKVVEEALALVNAHLQDVRNLRSVGLVAPNDVLSAEAARSRQEVIRIEARNSRDVAVTGCFLRTLDDLVVIKADKGQGESQRGPELLAKITKGRHGIGHFSEKHSEP